MSARTGSHPGKKTETTPTWKNLTAAITAIIAVVLPITLIIKNWDDIKRGKAKVSANIDSPELTFGYGEKKYNANEFNPNETSTNVEFSSTLFITNEGKLEAAAKDITLSIRYDSSNLEIINIKEVPHAKHISIGNPYREKLSGHFDHKTENNAYGLLKQPRDFAKDGGLGVGTYNKSEHLLLVSAAITMENGERILAEKRYVITLSESPGNNADGYRYTFTEDKRARTLPHNEPLR